MVQHISLEQFKKLNEHLVQIEPIYEKFCKKYSFYIIDTGRYPRKRIQTKKELFIFFDIAMETNEQGDDFTEFYPEIPYSITTGAQIIINGYRYYKLNMYLRQIPFNILANNLYPCFEKEYQMLKDWTIDILTQDNLGFKCGEYPQIGKNTTNFIEILGKPHDIEYIFNIFCKNHDFILIFHKKPEYNIKLLHYSNKNIVFCFKLKKDIKGENSILDSFIPEDSYSLIGKAWIEENKIRYTKTTPVFKNWPLLAIKKDLYNEIYIKYDRMSKWTYDFIKSTGVATEIK